MDGTCWWPTAKARTAKANPQGPWPGTLAEAKAYIATLYQGTLSVIDLPDRKHWNQQMAAWTAEAYACTPLKAGAAVTVAPPTGNPIPAKVGDPSPIKYVIYIIKENRTYDQVLGDMPQGNGDAKLCLFPDRVTPNHHKLARDFVLLDNFYADAEVSATGHEWSMGAYCTDFVEKTWPVNYGHNRNGKYSPTPVRKAIFPSPSPSAGYLWDRAAQGGCELPQLWGICQLRTSRRTSPADARVKGLRGAH